MKAILAGLAALGFAACSPQTPAASNPAAPKETEVFTFACANGQSFTVSYDEGATTATVKASGQTYTLPAVISASGARYTDNKVEFWEKGGEAMLNGAAGGPYEACPLKDPS